VTRDEFDTLWGDDEPEPDLRWLGVVLVVVFSALAWTAIGLAVWWLVR